MIKRIALALIAAVLLPAFIAAEGAAANTVTTPAPLSLTQAAAAAAPLVLYNALGIDIGMVGRVIPGVSYTRVVDTHASWSVFAGAIYDGDIFMVLLQANAYYLLNEYIYVGLGVSGTLDEDHTAMFGIANPSIGLLSSVTDNIKFYVETTVLIFTYRTKNDSDQSITTNNPLPVLKMGLRYYF